jgi:hypothetical protein
MNSTNKGGRPCKRRLPTPPLAFIFAPDKVYSKYTFSNTQPSPKPLQKELSS